MDQLEHSSWQEPMFPMLFPTPTVMREKGSSRSAGKHPGCEEAELHPKAQEQKAQPRVLGSSLPPKPSPCLHAGDNPRVNRSV